MQSRAGHKNSRIMRYWIKEYQVEFVYLLNSSCHQDSQSIDTRIHKSFLQDSFLFWFWQPYSHLENKHQQLLCILCETLQGDLFSSCHDSTSFLGTFFFPCGSWYHLARTDFPQPLPHPALGGPSRACVSTSQFCGSWNKTMFLFIFTSLG